MIVSNPVLLLYLLIIIFNERTVR